MGDRVTFDSTVWCGACRFCREGRVNLCDEREVVGVSCGEFRRDGAFAESVVVPQRIVHRLPEGVSFEEAAFAEPVGVALRAVGRAGNVSGKSAVVVGAGLIGLLVIQALKRAGAAQVIAVDLAPTRLALARELGADLALSPDDEAAQSLACDLAMEVVGIAPTVKLAVQSVVKGGRVVLVGNLAPEVPFPLQAVVTRELDILGTCAIAGEYLDALAAIAEGPIRVRPLITEVFSLEEGVAAFQTVASEGVLKVLVSPEK